MLDHFANNNYEWMHCSTNRRNELKQLSKDVFEVNYVVLLQIHVVRWFFGGSVMTRLLKCMLALLSRDEEMHWYEIMYSFRFHFYLNLLVHVL